MRRKIYLKSIAILMILLMMTGCHSNNENKSFTNSQMNEEMDPLLGDNEGEEEYLEGKKASQIKEINIFICCPEYEEAFEHLFSEYEKEHSDIVIHYETTQKDYPTVLKAKLNEGTVPDIFSTSSGKEIDIYKNWTYDLSKEPVADRILPSIADVMKSGEEQQGLYGVAFKDNYFGIIYNNDVLKKSGIKKYPQTLSELEQACEKIRLAGYRPFAKECGEWWVYKHIWQQFQQVAAQSKGITVAEFVERLEHGRDFLDRYSVINKNMFRFINLFKKYEEREVNEVSLAEEIEDFASGNAAMILGQGVWLESDLLKCNEKLDLGFYGYPVSEEPNDCKIIAGADQAIRIYKDSPVLEEVIEFINWWYTSDYGVHWFTDIAGVIPPIQMNTKSDSMLISQGIELEKMGMAAPLGICYSSDRFYQQLGEKMRMYLKDEISSEEFCRQLQEVWQQIDGE